MTLSSLHVTVSDIYSSVPCFLKHWLSTTKSVSQSSVHNTGEGPCQGWGPHVGSVTSRTPGLGLSKIGFTTFTVSASFLHQIFIEHPLCARSCVGHLASVHEQKLLSHRADVGVGRTEYQTRTCTWGLPASPLMPASPPSDCSHPKNSAFQFEVLCWT